MSNKTYDTLKFIALIIVPFVTMVASILSAVGLIEAGEIVLAVGTAVDTFMGAFVAIASKIYNEKKVIE